MAGSASEPAIPQQECIRSDFRTTGSQLGIIACLVLFAPIAAFADDNPDQMTAGQFIAFCQRDAKWCSHWVTNYYVRIMIGGPANTFCPSGKEDSSDLTEKVVTRMRSFIVEGM